MSSVFFDPAILADSASPPPGSRGKTFVELQAELGDIPAYRILVDPAPGKATEDDLHRLNERHDRLCELIDGVLVEKTMGRHESKIAVCVAFYLLSCLEQHDLGEVYGTDGPVKVLPEQIRMPDVCFVSHARAQQTPREEKTLWSSPDLAVEVLSKGNTAKEMKRKLREYFAGGARLAWYIDPRTQTARSYTAENNEVFVPADGALDGGEVLPGFKLSLADLFAKVGPRG
jgi:Uma2 family endonuclease